MTTLQCSRCSATLDPFPPRYKCERCGDLLEYIQDFERLKEVKLTGPHAFWRYKPLFPILHPEGVLNFFRDPSNAFEEQTFKAFLCWNIRLAFRKSS